VWRDKCGFRYLLAAAGAVKDSTRRVVARRRQVLGNGPGDEDGVTGSNRLGRPVVDTDTQDRASDAEFRREWERHYLRSVRAAALEVLESSSWLSESEAEAALTDALQRRGIEAYPDAVRAGAALIYRGRRPRILDLDLAPTGGRRRRG
jgi:hypothetical protein